MRNTSPLGWLVSNGKVPAKEEEALGTCGTLEGSDPRIAQVFCQFAEPVPVPASATKRTPGTTPHPNPAHPWKRYPDCRQAESRWSRKGWVRLLGGWLHTGITPGNRSSDNIDAEFRKRTYLMSVVQLLSSILAIFWLRLNLQLAIYPPPLPPGFTGTRCIQ